jgi:hypothetical protein
VQLRFKSSKGKKWSLLIKIIPVLFAIFVAKLIVHGLGFEIVDLNALFTSIIAATTFLIGFLIAGVITDYKESEKIPGDIAASLETIYDEAYILEKNKQSKITKDFLLYYNDFLESMVEWFYRKQRTKAILEKLHGMNDYFGEFESSIQSGFLSRMKNEQCNLRKQVIRIDNIRDLSFIQSGYIIVEILAFLVIAGLILMKLTPFYEAMFFSLTVSFLLIYMIVLIKDLDNPFDYSTNGESGTEVSLKPINDLIARVKEYKKISLEVPKTELQKAPR